jgi:hypothetical protein
MNPPFGPGKNENPPAPADEAKLLCMSEINDFQQIGGFSRERQGGNE